MWPAVPTWDTTRRAEPEEDTKQLSTWAAAGALTAGHVGEGGERKAEVRED